jgi:hypothetical protein
MVTIVTLIAILVVTAAIPVLLAWGVASLTLAERAGIPPPPGCIRLSNPASWTSKWFATVLIMAVPLVAIVGNVTTLVAAHDYSSLGRGLLMLIVMLIVPFAFAHHLYLSKVDDVYDCGDHLVIRKGNHSETISISNILSVTYVKQRTPYVRILLATPCGLGHKIDFFDSKDQIRQYFRRNATDDVMRLIARVKDAQEGRVA